VQKMETISVKTKAWGNSIGVILPKSLGILANEAIDIKIIKERKLTKVKDMWGILKKKGNTQEILDELNQAEFEGDL